MTAEANQKYGSESGYIREGNGHRMTGSSTNDISMTFTLSYKTGSLLKYGHQNI
jgi:hypothetical protein